MNQVDFYLEDLKSKFLKIDPDKYYLSYSGGKDSHFIFWFLRTWLKKNDYMMYLDYLVIRIVGLNTYMEHPEILARIKKNSHIVLRSRVKPFEIKEKYGSPCFSKFQDEMIDRYQKGCRTDYLLNKINDPEKGSRFNLNKTARDGLQNNTLHRISNKCCEYLKKRPVREFEKKTGLKAIIGVRGAESILRKSQYTSCFTKNGNFTPIHDLTDELIKEIYFIYKIETPSVYEHIDRTGCMGCPYGSYKGNTQKELGLVSENQKKFLKEYFKETYELLGIKEDDGLSKEEREQIENGQISLF